MPINFTRRDFLKNSSIAATIPFLANTALGANNVNYDAMRKYHKTYEIPTICSHCRSRCHALALIQDGKLLKLKTNSNSSYNKTLCARGMAAVKQLYDPDRLKFPLKRIGKRGLGKWRRISWGEAIDTITQKIEKALENYGPDALGLFVNQPSSSFIQELFQELAVKNIYNSTYDYSKLAQKIAYQNIFGETPAIPQGLDYQKTECVVLMGSSQGENIELAELTELSKRLALGIKLIVVDPRFSAIAAKSEYHLMIKPGTDTALILGWINHIIENGLYNSKYIEQNTNGFEQLQDWAKRYPVERVASITDLSPEQIRTTAELIAQTAPSVIIHPGNKSARYGNDVERCRAMAILTGLIASWKARGGISPENKNSANHSLSSPAPATVPDHNRISGTDLIRKMASGRIKIAGCWGQNPIHSCSNPYRTIQALKKVDFFFVTDILPSETSLYADIILPEATFLERHDLSIINQEKNSQTLALQYPAIDPLFESKEAYWIVKQLSSRLGHGGNFKFEKIKNRLDNDLSEYNLSCEKIFELGGVTNIVNMSTDSTRPLESPEEESDQVVPEVPAAILSEPGESALTPASGAPEPSETDAPFDEVDPVDPFEILQSDIPGFPTPSGKIEFYSTSFVDKGFSALPDFEPVAEPPAGYLRLITGRSPVHSGTYSVNNQWLIHEFEENELWINEEVAQKLKLKGNQKYFLQNQDGIKNSQPVKIKITPGIRRDCVFLVHGFGQNSQMLLTGFNKGISDAFLLTRSLPDPISGVRGKFNNFVRLLSPDGRVMENETA
jgi:thiosulfate reductase / polysulfide reductase chain A